MLQLKKWHQFLILLIVSVIISALCEMLISGIEYNFIPVLYQKLLFTANSIPIAYHNHLGAAFIGIKHGGNPRIPIWGSCFVTWISLKERGLCKTLRNFALTFLSYLFGWIYYLSPQCGPSAVG